MNNEFKDSVKSLLAQTYGSFSFVLLYPNRPVISLPEFGAELELSVVVRGEVEERVDDGGCSRKGAWQEFVGKLQSVSVLGVTPHLQFFQYLIFEEKLKQQFISTFRENYSEGFINLRRIQGRARQFSHYKGLQYKQRSFSLLQNNFQIQLLFQGQRLQFVHLVEESLLQIEICFEKGLWREDLGALKVGKEVEVGLGKESASVLLMLWLKNVGEKETNELIAAGLTLLCQIEDQQLYVLSCLEWHNLFLKNQHQLVKKLSPTHLSFHKNQHLLQQTVQLRTHFPHTSSPLHHFGVTGERLVHELISSKHFCVDFGQIFNCDFQEVSAVVRKCTNQLKETLKVEVMVLGWSEFVGVIVAKSRQKSRLVRGFVEEVLHAAESTRTSRDGKESFDNKVEDHSGGLFVAGPVEAENPEQAFGEEGEGGLEPVDAFEEKGKVFGSGEGVADEGVEGIFEFRGGFLGSQQKFIHFLG